MPGTSAFCPRPSRCDFSNLRLLLSSLTRLAPSPVSVSEPRPVDLNCLPAGEDPLDHGPLGVGAEIRQESARPKDVSTAEISSRALEAFDSCAAAVCYRVVTG